VPTFTRTLTTRGSEAAWRLGNLVINTLLLVTGALVVLGMLFATPITSAIAPKFALVPGKLELTALLTRIMLPFLTTVAIAVAMMGMLNSLHRFFIPALSPAMFNVATIGCALALAPVMPRFGLDPIVSIAVGTLLGGVGQVLLQWPVLRRQGYHYQPLVDVKDPALREVMRLMIPGTVGLAAVQVNVLVNAYLAARLETGAVSWLNYAFRLMYLPIGLFGVSIATAALPEIARHAAVNDTPAIRRTVSSGLRLMLMLNVPATVGLMVLSQPIISLLLERYRFTAQDTAATAAALMFYAPGLLGYSAVKLASPTFYSLGDSRTPVIVSITSMVANLALNIALARLMGFRGLALGTAIAAMLNAIVLLLLLRRRVGGIEGRRVAVALLKISIAAGVMGVVAAYSSQWLQDALPGRELHWKLVQVFGAIGASLLVLAAAARLLRISEFDEAFGRVMRRLRPTLPPSQP
jgi:putative peptidoglycan lipid II flippase